MELAELIEKSRVDNVILRRGPRPKQAGSLALIGHHLIFSPNPPPGQKPSHDDELWLLHRAIDRVSVENLNKSANASPTSGAHLTLKCKNFLICVFEIANVFDCAAVARSIETLSNLNNRHLDYPFYYQCPFKVLDNGWNVYDIELEFTRLCSILPDRFRISPVNKNFTTCVSYPEKVIVPKGIGDDYLRISATFRDSCRFPVLSFVEAHSKSVIVRTSQPLLGPTNRRCTEDEVILNAYLGNTTKGFIFDTRPKSLILAAKARGGGAEPPFCYRAWSYVHLNLPRINELQESLAKLVDVCGDADANSNYLSRVNYSNWLTHIHSMIHAAGILSQSIKIHNRGATHVVHGSEGLDMTLVLTSLAEVILNPDCRTIRGFQALIEREWISAGHPFVLRCAHSAYAVGTLTGPYESPVFLAFLDCVWQISHAYPTSMEFNEQLLIYLFEHTYASEFGTFLCNNDKERRDLKVREKTVSLWSHMNHPEVLDGFLNPYYRPAQCDLWPISAAQEILLWERMFFRWRINWQDVDAKQQMAANWAARERELQTKLATLLSQQAQNNAMNSAASELQSCDITK
uniref:Myotubularin phosphatase domain-containing protein n=1 Tax=Panagrellus redivivus TaxID=6233 RepID=A0A7E4W328_PANRE